MTDTNTTEPSATSAAAGAAPVPTFTMPSSQAEFAAMGVEGQTAMFARLAMMEEEAAKADAVRARPAAVRPTGPAAIDTSVHVNTFNLDTINALSDEQLYGLLERDLDQPAGLSAGNHFTKGTGWDRLPPITAFHPDVQAELSASVGNDPARYPEAVRSHLVAKSAEYRLRTGAGSDRLNAFQREGVQANMDLEENTRWTNEALGRLQEMSGYDPKTGLPIHALRGHARKLTQARVDELGRHRKALLEREIPARMAAAKVEAVKELRERADRLNVEREAQAMAVQMTREERVKARAQEIAKSNRNKK